MNNKKCKQCRNPIDFNECKTDKELYRAKQLGLCIKCQGKTFDN